MLDNGQKNIIKRVNIEPFLKQMHVKRKKEIIHTRTRPQKYSSQAHMRSTNEARFNLTLYALEGQKRKPAASVAGAMDVQ